jgi:hypothetical protein
MPGLVPGIQRLPAYELRKLDAFPTRNFFFIIFLDAIFTTSFERLFTNVFDMAGAIRADCCVCRASHAN